MRLFFIISWPVRDPLTLATVIPHLAVLSADPRVEQIWLFSPERPVEGFITNHLDQSSLPPLPAKVQHYPLPSLQSRLPLLSRFRHHQRWSNRLTKAAQQLKPDLIFCRGAAAIHGASLQRRLSIPFVAESFEPHAEYMRQTGTWSRWDPKYLVQHRWECQVKRSAAALITVSQGYARHLQQQEGIAPARLHTVPCWVDAERFRLDPQARSRVRQQLGCGDRLAVVYAGKVGGIYSPLHELAMLRHLQVALGQSLHVIVLTSTDSETVRRQLRQVGFDDQQLFVDCVPHDHVGDYLNAADLALSFINSGPWSFACSAIKHGEYWACGLPLLMPPGVGDEAQWLEVEGAGAIAHFNDPAQVQRAGIRLRAILSEPGHRQRIRSIGLRLRSSEPMLRTYNHILEEFQVLPSIPV